MKSCDNKCTRAMVKKKGHLRGRSSPALPQRQIESVPSPSKPAKGNGLGWPDHSSTTICMSDMWMNIGMSARICIGSRRRRRRQIPVYGGGARATVVVALLHRHPHWWWLGVVPIRRAFRRIVHGYKGQLALTRWNEFTGEGHASAAAVISMTSLFVQVDDAIFDHVRR
jgi:hypothetical protein